MRSVCVSSSKWDLIPDSYDFFLPRRGPGLAGVGEPRGRAVNIPWGDNGPFEGNMEQMGVSPQDHGWGPGHGAGVREGVSRAAMPHKAGGCVVSTLHSM